MIKLKYITLIIWVTLLSCSENKQLKSEQYNQSRELVPKPEGYKKNTFIVDKNEPKIIDTLDQCNFNKYLTNSKTSQLAKNIFNNKDFDLNDNEALANLDSLTAKDKQARRFYFKVVTNSYKKSDGAYSEGLGYAGKEYIENNTKEFLNYFIGECRFTNNDFNDWVNIVMLEINILSENENKDELDKTINKLESNCADCSSTEKEVLSNFIEQLRTERENSNDNN